MGARLPPAIGLTSTALIAFQLVLMQILAIVQWHHYAALIISIALLGFGASGTCIALLREPLLKHFDRVTPLALLGCGVSMSGAVALSQCTPVRFDSLLLFAQPAYAWRLALTCLIYFVPFFLGALAIGLAFTRYPGGIGRLYGANLIGSGLGGGLALVLMGRFLPEAIPALIAILPIAGGIILYGGRTSALTACIALAPVLWMAYHPPALVLSEYKALRKALDLPGSLVVSTRVSPFGRLDIVAAPALRYAPGVSLVFGGQVPVTRAVFRNGDWFGPLLGDSRQAAILDYTTAALPYALGERRQVLVLDAGTGANVAPALARGASVQAVEPNPPAAELLRQTLGDGSRVRVAKTSSRTWLMRDTARYDLITLPMLDAFGGTSGLQALEENYLLTLEAIARMYDLLTPQGLLSVSCWLDYPPRTSLRLIATLAEVLRRQGREPRAHLAAVRGWGTMTVVMQRRPLTPPETGAVRDFCARLGFDPVLLPGLAAKERTRWHALPDTGWLDDIDRVLSLRNLGGENVFNLRPPTDDRPYFSQFLTRRGLVFLKDLYGLQAVPFFEIGYLILILATILLSVLAVVLIVLPLRRTGRPGAAGVYFGAIGVGYMFMEIVLIQRFILYLGSPIHAAAIVIGAMLILSGLGSLAVMRRQAPARLVLAGISGLILLAVFSLPPLLHATVALPLPARIGLALLLISPLGFSMGMPFPLGMSALSTAEIPWAWGVNGCLSVVSAPLAAIIAVEMGFTWVMILAALAYAVACMTNATPPSPRNLQGG